MTPRLQELDLPTLVIHGQVDTVCDVSGGRAIAAAIPGAELVVIDGLGHNLPPGLWDASRITSPRLYNVAKRRARDDGDERVF